MCTSGMWCDYTSHQLHYCSNSPYLNSNLFYKLPAYICFDLSFSLSYYVTQYNITPKQCSICEYKCNAVCGPDMSCTDLFSALVRLPVHSLTSRGHSHGHSHSFCSILKTTTVTCSARKLHVIRFFYHPPM